MAIPTRRAVKHRRKQSSQEPMSSDSEDGSWAHNVEEVDKEEDDEVEAPRPKTRQTRTRGRSQRKRKGFSVLRYRVQDFKQRVPLSPAHEFDSSLRTLRLDPAALCISELTDPQVKAVIHKTTTVFWPSFRVYAETSIVDPWLEQMYKSTVLYHSVLAGHGSMMQAANITCTTPRAETFIQRNAATAMREMRRLAEKQPHATDEMLIAASYLSMTPRPRSERYGRVGGLGFGLFTPPLQKLQAMDGHGRIYFAEPHRSAAMLMVKQRGGIGEVRAVGIAEGLQCYDLHSSAQALEPPTLELAQSAEHFIRTFIEPERQKWRDVHTSSSPSHESADGSSFGFDELDIPDDDISDLLVDMRVYSEHVHAFLSGDPAPEAREMAMFRNMIQYRLLLKLPEFSATRPWAHAAYQEESSTLSSHKQQQVLVHELTVLGALLFSYGALYPSPPWDAKRKLLEMLRDRLKEVVLRGLDRWRTRNEAGFLMWLSVLGCMMAVGPDVLDGTGMATQWTHEYQIGAADEHHGGGSGGGGNGDVFFKLLVWCQTRLGFGAYGEVRGEMQRWLWLDEACDEGARRVWAALVRIGEGGDLALPMDL